MSFAEAFPALACVAGMVLAGLFPIRARIWRRGPAPGTPTPIPLTYGGERERASLTWYGIISPNEQREARKS